MQLFPRYHILFRLAPYERTTLSPKEIIEEVKRRNLKPILENTLPEEKPVSVKTIWGVNIQLSWWMPWSSAGNATLICVQNCVNCPKCFPPFSRPGLFGCP